MKIKEIAEQMINATEKITVDNDVFHLTRVFGNDFFSDMKPEIRYKDFQKGIRSYVELKQSYIRKMQINLDQHPHSETHGGKFIRLYESEQLKHEVDTMGPHNQFQVYGKLFGYPPSAINFFVERMDKLRTPGELNEEVFFVSWSSSSFVTNKDLLEENLHWMKQHYGTEKGKCQIYKLTRKLKMEEREGRVIPKQTEKQFFESVVSIPIRNVEI